MIFKNSAILIITLILFQCVSVKEIRIQNEKVYEGIKQYMEKQVLPNEYSYSKELSSVLNSIDTAIMCILSHVEEEDKLALNRREFSSLCLFIYKDGLQLRDRLEALYKSDKRRYKFLLEKYPLTQERWYVNYFMNKSTIEVLLELSVLKQQLIICYFRNEDENEG